MTFVPHRQEPKFVQMDKSALVETGQMIFYGCNRICSAGWQLTFEENNPESIAMAVHDTYTVGLGGNVHNSKIAWTTAISCLAYQFRVVPRNKHVFLSMMHVCFIDKYETAPRFGSFERDCKVHSVCFHPTLGFVLCETQSYLSPILSEDQAAQV